MIHFKINNNRVVKLRPGTLLSGFWVIVFFLLLTVLPWWVAALTALGLSIGTGVILTVVVSVGIWISQNVKFARGSTSSTD